MNELIEVIAIVEGRTEEIFIKEIVSPHLLKFSKSLTPIIASKSGQKGGSIHFERFKLDIERFLKQRPRTYLTMFVDYYGIDNGWPGLEKAKQTSDPHQISAILNGVLSERILKLYEPWNPNRRFIPYFSIHEFEALLFSAPDVLAEHLLVKTDSIHAILAKAREPERINTSPKTAPSKRLEMLNPRFKKAITGISIAKEIGLDRMRTACPIFGTWLTQMETLSAPSAPAPLVPV